MAVIVVSACLLGHSVRYNGSALAPDDSWLGGLAGNHILCPFCPETAAGLPVPRSCAEIVGGDGHDVLHGRAEVVDATGRSLTAAFRLAAALTLDFCRERGADLAILTESSPSCGSGTIHDGTFCGIRKAGRGVTAALLTESGVMVFSQHQLAAIASFLAGAGDRTGHCPSAAAIAVRRP